MCTTGGAIVATFVGTAELRDCTFLENRVAGGVNGRGGAIWAEQSTIRIANGSFIRNRAENRGHGGAIGLGTAASAFVVNCRFRGNGTVEPEAEGGAILAEAFSSATFVNCEFVGNYANQDNDANATGGGGAIHTVVDLAFVNCTFSQNVSHRGPGAFVDGATLSATNTIFWGNWNPFGPADQIFIAGGGSALVTFSDVEGGFPGIGNRAEDPEFLVDPTLDMTDGLWGTFDDVYGDVRLGGTSICIDAGYSTAVPADEADVDGDMNLVERVPLDLAEAARFVNDPFTPDTGIAIVDTDGFPKVVDMGAYEFTRPDCNSNGRPDEVDILVAEGGTCVGPACTGPDTPPGCCSHDCNQDGQPDECQVPPLCPECDDCDNDNVPDECQFEGAVDSTWTPPATQPALWNVAANWCQPLVPDNGTPAGNTYSVVVPATQPATLNISPTIDAMTVEAGGIVQVDAASGASFRSLAVVGGMPSQIINSGTLLATDRRRLLLDVDEIVQSGGGTLMATAGVGTGTSILEINRARVIGGFAITDPTDSEIRLIGGATLDGVSVQGVVVPDGQTGGFASTVTNSGVLRVAQAGAATTLFAPSDAGGVLQGDDVGEPDCVRLNGQSTALLGNFKATFTNAGNHAIDGTGIVFGGLVNDGEVVANVFTGGVSKRLTLFPPGDKTNGVGATMRAADGATLRLADAVLNEGLFEADSGGIVLIDDVVTSNSVIMAGSDGLVEIRADVGGSGNLVSSGGRVVVNRNVTVVANCIDVPPGSVSFVDIGFEPDGPATVNALEMIITGGIVTIGNGSVVTISGVVTICPDTLSDPLAVAELHVLGSTLNAGTLDICPGGVLIVASEVALGEALINAMTDGTAVSWSWAGGSVLRLTGGQGASGEPGSLAGWMTLEAASEDLGAVQSGGLDNFGLAQLTLEVDAHVSLVDYADNSAGAPEAVYCETLWLEEGATLNLNGLALYAGGQRVMAGSKDYGPGAVVDGFRGILGDVNGDGRVDWADAPMLVDVLLGEDTNPAHRGAADMNGDGEANGDDIQEWVTAAMP